MNLYEELIFSIVDDIVTSDTNYYFIIQKLSHLSRILEETFSGGRRRVFKKC